MVLEITVLCFLLHPRRVNAPAENKMFQRDRVLCRGGPERNKSARRRCFARFVPSHKKRRSCVVAASRVRLYSLRAKKSLDFPFARLFLFVCILLKSSRPPPLFSSRILRLSSPASVMYIRASRVAGLWLGGKKPPPRAHAKPLIV